MEKVVATNHFFKNYQVLPEGQVRVVTDTDGIRGDLSINLVRRAINFNVPIVVCDGGSSSAFRSQLEQFTDRGLTVVTSEPGRGPQRRAAFKAALDLEPEAIVYTQAEKSPLMNFINLISAPVVSGHADIVIPWRIPEVAQPTYPDYMWQSERAVNKEYDKLVGRSFDWFFGPVVFSGEEEVAELFMKKYVMEGEVRTRSGILLDPEKYSNSHYLPILEAQLAGMTIRGVEVPFEYPALQLANETAPELIGAYKERRKADAEVYVAEAKRFRDFKTGIQGSKIRAA